MSVKLLGRLESVLLMRTLGALCSGFRSLRMRKKLMITLRRDCLIKELSFVLFLRKGI